MRYSFVIPAYNNFHLLHQLLFDIYKNCATPHEVIIMDDASDDETFLGGISWWETTQLLPVNHVRNKEDLGFLKNSNKGLQMATGDIVSLVSTDVRIFSDITKFFIGRDGLVGGRYLDWDTGWNTFGGRIFPYLEGWLLTAYRETWKELGYFDERYAPHDFEDVDISTGAISLGLRLASYPTDWTNHLGGQSIGYNPEREALTKINQKKFEKKWIK